MPPHYRFTTQVRRLGLILILLAVAVFAPTASASQLIDRNAQGVQLAVNGKEVSGASHCVPRAGYICLESEGSECHFRNIRIKELPSTQPAHAEKATLDQSLISLYSGLDLRGWKSEPGHAGHWRSSDSVLEYDGKSTAKGKEAASGAKRPNNSAKKGAGDNDPAVSEPVASPK